MTGSNADNKKAGFKNAPAFLLSDDKILSYFINYSRKSDYFGAESGDCPLPFLWWRMYLY
jgi:hypothetical protein